MAAVMRSPVMLLLVSTRMPRLIGSGLSENTATSCRTPSSKISKSSFVSPVTMLPSAAVTVRSR